jgi:hypothetical protein
MVKKKQEIVPTKLDVFSMQFDVNTPGFLKEAAENCNGGMYAVCWNIFRTLIAMVAERATELNDPIMNVLMLRLNLYEVPVEERHKIIEQIRKEIEDGKETHKERP